MAAIFYPLFTLATVGLLPWGIFLCHHAHCFESVLLVFIAIAIAYDNAITSIGRWLGQGKLLLLVSQPRFFFHVTLTPFTTAVVLCQCQRAGVSWVNSPGVSLLVWGLNFGLVVYDLLDYYRDFDPVAVWFQGTLRYTNAAASTPPLPAAITVILVVVFGVLLGWHTGWWWLCGAAVAMLLGSAAPQRWLGPTLSSGVETLLLAGMWATESYIQGHFS